MSRARRCSWARPGTPRGRRAPRPAPLDRARPGRRATARSRGRPRGRTQTGSRPASTRPAKSDLCSVRATITRVAGTGDGQRERLVAVGRAADREAAHVRAPEPRGQALGPAQHVAGHARVVGAGDERQVELQQRVGELGRPLVPGHGEGGPGVGQEPVDGVCERALRHSAGGVYAAVSRSPPGNGASTAASRAPARRRSSDPRSPSRARRACPWRRVRGRSRPPAAR